MFDQSTINFPNGAKLDIMATNNAAAHPYIDHMTWNNQPYSKNYLMHEDLIKGGTIEFKMSKAPNLLRGTTQADRPYSMSDER